MTPIEQVKPLPGANWVRRGEEKRKRQDKGPGQPPLPPKDRKPAKPGVRPERSIDELA